MADMMRDVVDFHEKFELTYEGQVRNLPKGLQDFRSKFLTEELEEYLSAVEEKDIVGQADALIDLIYVALGSAYLMGLEHVWTDLWDEVQKANMKKVRATNTKESKRGSLHDVVKPDGWVGPDLHKFLEGNG